MCFLLYLLFQFLFVNSWKTKCGIQAAESEKISLKSKHTDSFWVNAHMKILILGYEAFSSKSQVY